MKKLQICLATALAATFLFCMMPNSGSAENSDDYVQEDIEELQDRMDTVERKVLQDKINIGAEVRTRFDIFSYEDKLNDDTDHSNLPSFRFRLNMKAKPTKKLQFHARLTTYTYFGEYVDPAFAGAFARTPSDATLKVERAYMDYFFDFAPMVLTIGRLPLGDGLPTNLRENTPRKSTYPGIAYDFEGEGIALSFNLDNAIHLPGSSVKFLYVPVARFNSNEIYREGETEGYPLCFFQFETGFTGMLQDIHFILNIAYLPEISPLDPSKLLTILQQEEGMTMTIPNPGGGTTDIPLYDVDMLASHRKKLGTMTNYNFYLQSERFMESWVDWFIGYGFQMHKGENEPVTYYVDMNNDGIGDIPLTNIGLFSSGNGPAMPGTKNEDKDASIFHIGMRINFPFAPLNEPKLGLEFNQGSQYLINGPLASEDPLHKLDTSGKAWDFYYLQPIDRNFFIRIGHTMIQKDYKTDLAWWYGARRDVDEQITNTYMLFDMKF